MTSPQPIRPTKFHRHTALNLASKCISKVVLLMHALPLHSRTGFISSLLVFDDLLQSPATSCPAVYQDFPVILLCLRLLHNAVSDDGKEEGRLELTLGELCKTLVSVCTSGTLCTTLPVRIQSPSNLKACMCRHWLSDRLAVSKGEAWGRPCQRFSAVLDKQGTCVHSFLSCRQVFSVKVG